MFHHDHLESNFNVSPWKRKIITDQKSRVAVPWLTNGTYTEPDTLVCFKKKANIRDFVPNFFFLNKGGKRHVCP